MSDDHQPPYNPLIIKAWTIGSLIISLGLLGMLVLGRHLLPAGHVVWDLLRWLASPLI